MPWLEVAPNPSPIGRATGRTRASACSRRTRGEITTHLHAAITGLPQRTTRGTAPKPAVAPLSASPSPRGRRICIVLMSAVGDVVHALPVVNALRRHEPESRISWVLHPGPATLVRGHPSVDEIITLDRRRGWRAFAELRRPLRDHRFDLTIALQDYFKAGIVTALTRAPERLGYDRARARDLSWIFTNRRIAAHPRAHIQDEFLEFAAALGVPAEPLEWRLGPWPEERVWQAELRARVGAPYAALVIGSSRPEKDWLPERWAELASALAADFGLRTVIAGGRSPREAATERAVLERAGASSVSALDSGLRRLVGILDAAALTVSLDTGPLHIAVALERPVVSLMAYTNPARYGPYRRYQDLVVNAYGDPMRGGVLATDRRPGRMARITVREVLEKVERWRARYAAGA